MYMKEGMDMRKIMLLAVLFVSLWCNSALAWTMVQMDDNHSVYEIIQKYNDYCMRTDSNYAEYMLPTSLIKENTTYMEYTTTYSARNYLTDILVFFCINDNGKLSSFSVIIPKTRPESDCAEIASRIIRAINGGHSWEDVFVGCRKAVITGEVQVVWSPADKRCFVFNGGTEGDCYKLLAMAYQK
jgi:hypothetical protein